MLDRTVFGRGEAAGVSVAVQAESTFSATTPHLAGQRLRALLAYWDNLRGPAFAPPRSAIRPAAIPRLLPCLVLAEIATGGERLRIRLAGTHVVNGLAGDPTGHELDPEAAGPVETLLLEPFLAARDLRRPHAFGPARARHRGSDVVLREGLALPLSADGRSVDMILAGLELAPLSRIGPLAQV